MKAPRMNPRAIGTNGRLRPSMVLIKIAFRQKSSAVGNVRKAAPPKECPLARSTAQPALV